MILRSHVHACVVIVAVASILCACSDDDPAPGGTTEESVPVVGAPPSSSPSSGTVRTDPQRLFGSARPLRSNLPAGLPSIDPSSYLSILDEPLSGPAIVAAVQIDAEAEATSFADQPVTFIDAEGQRRSLDPTDLGLGQDQWIAADGSGLGALSPSGEMWAMVTREKVVTLTLATGRVQTAELPDGELPTSPHGSDQTSSWSALMTDAERPIWLTSTRWPLRRSTCRDFGCRS